MFSYTRSYPFGLKEKLNEIIISDLQGEMGIRDIKHFYLEKTGRQTLISDPLLVGGYIKVTYKMYIYNLQYRFYQGFI